MLLLSDVAANVIPPWNHGILMYGTNSHWKEWPMPKYTICIITIVISLQDITFIIWTESMTNWKLSHIKIWGDNTVCLYFVFAMSEFFLTVFHVCWRITILEKKTRRPYNVWHLQPSLCPNNPISQPQHDINAFGHRYGTQASANLLKIDIREV